MKMILNKLPDDGEGDPQKVGECQIGEATAYGIQKDDQIIFGYFLAANYEHRVTVWLVFRKLFVFDEGQVELHLFAADAIEYSKRGGIV